MRAMWFLGTAAAWRTGGGVAVGLGQCRRWGLRMCSMVGCRARRCRRKRSSKCGKRVCGKYLGPSTRKRHTACAQARQAA